MSAVLALAERKEPSRKEDIKLFLEAEALAVRALAAGALADMGGTSGLEIMRRDFARHIPADMAFNHLSIFRDLRSRYVKAYDVLKVARALAKLGDPRGGRFAEFAALRAPYPGERMAAVETLSELIEHVSSEELKQQGLAPVSVLEQVARNDSGTIVLSMLSAHMRRPEIDPEIAVRMLDAMAGSTSLGDIERQTLNDFRAQRREEARLKAQARAADQRSTLPPVGTRPAETRPASTQPATTSPSER